MSNARRGGLVLAIVSGFIAGCGAPGKKAEGNIPAAEPQPASTPKFRGTAKIGGLQAEIAVTPGGEYNLAFLDAAGDDLPAATASNVSLEVDHETVRLDINDTGESWVGKGRPLRDAATPARLAFTFQGKPASADVALTQVDLPLDYVCPMDPDIRSAAPGTCSRCGMKLVLGIPDPEEYPLRVQIAPAEFHAREKVQLVFTVENPATLKIVEHFEIVHERLFHLFIVGADLRYFLHDHPKFDRAENFRFDTSFPKPGMYRLLADFYPSGGTPQLAPKTIFVPGPPGAPVPLADAELAPDTALQHGKNTDVALVLDAPRLVAGTRARLVFRLTPGDGLEKYLGAWAHMLAASDDLIDLLHEHPMSADGGPQIGFDLIFPRARTYRIWVQFQRRGVVNTVAFNVPVN